VDLELSHILPSVDADPQEQARAATEVRELLRAVPDPVLRFSYGRRAADRLGLPPEVLWRSERQRTAEPEPDGAPSQRIVTSLEERVLQLLLESESVVPGLEELPPAEVFLGEESRNIYGRFLALYAEDGSPPGSRAVLAVVSHEGETLDHLARILLEESSCSESEELRESLSRLTRRWQQHRLRTLAQQIKQAQRDGEAQLLLQLVEEKTSLTRLLHELEPPAVG